MEIGPGVAFTDPASFAVKKVLERMQAASVDASQLATEAIPRPGLDDTNHKRVAEAKRERQVFAAE